MKKKTLLATGITFLFFGLTLSPATATLPSSSVCLTEQELMEIDQILYDLIDEICNAKDYENFLEILNDFKSRLDKFQIMKQIIESIREGIDKLKDFFNKDSMPTSKFIISYGIYDRLNPRKENEMKFIKSGFTMWHYSGTPTFRYSNSGRTIIIEKTPDFTKKHLGGRQIGVMKGFRGIYIDFKSKITDKTYLFFMGNAERANGIELPFLFKDTHESNRAGPIITSLLYRLAQYGAYQLFLIIFNLFYIIRPF
jgi:hypothetical protein